MLLIQFRLETPAKFRKIESPPSLEKRLTLYVVGFSTYDDGFGDDRTVLVRWFYDPEMNAFLVCTQKEQDKNKN